MNFLARVVRSLFVVFEALFYVLLRPGIWLWVVLPMILNFVFAIILFTNINEWVGSGFEKIYELDWFAQNGFWDSLFGILSAFLAFVISAWVILTFGMLVSAPFNGLIAERILDENQVENKVGISGIRLVFFEIWRSIKFESSKLLLTIGFFLLTLVLNGIPILGTTFFLILNFGFQAFLNTLDLLDTSHCRDNMGFGAKIRSVVRNTDIYLPFGVVATFILTVPFLNILFIPFAHVGATLLFVKAYSDERPEISQTQR